MRERPSNLNPRKRKAISAGLSLNIGPDPVFTQAEQFAGNRVAHEAQGIGPMKRLMFRGGEAQLGIYKMPRPAGALSSDPTRSPPLRRFSSNGPDGSPAEDEAVPTISPAFG